MQRLQTSSIMFNLYTYTYMYNYILYECHIHTYIVTVTYIFTHLYHGLLFFLSILKACLGCRACPFVPLKPKEDTAALLPRHCRSSLEMEAANPESSILLFSLRLLFHLYSKIPFKIKNSINQLKLRVFCQLLILFQCLTMKELRRSHLSRLLAEPE